MRGISATSRNVMPFQAAVIAKVAAVPRFYRFSDFGKTVFLTREEAEAALEAMKDE